MIGSCKYLEADVIVLALVGIFIKKLEDVSNAQAPEDGVETYDREWLNGAVKILNHRIFTCLRNSRIASQTLQQFMLNTSNVQ